MASTVRDYHQGLAQHLLDLIRKSTSAAISSSPRKASIPSATPPAPNNPRQHSDSSLESNSRISSGETTNESRESRRQSRSSENDVGTSPEGETRGSSGFSVEDYNVYQTGGSLSPRNDLTARPNSHPSRFPSLSPPQIQQDLTLGPVAETSASGAQRYASGSPPSPSRQSRSGRTRTRHITIPSSQTELLTREAEHRQAWETDGRRVWRKIPQGFELKLEKKPRSGSNESTDDRSGAVSIHSGVSGAGPGTAIRPDDVFVIDVEPRDLERISSSGRPTNRESESISEASKLEGEPAVASESSVSLSMAKPTIKRTSTLQRRQARVEAEAEAEANLLSQTQVAAALVETVAPVEEDIDDAEVDDKASESMPAMSDDEQEEYIRKREMRLRKKEYVLKKKIGIWWQGVQESGLHQTLTTTPPEIDPHIPSPTRGLDSSMLRFPPLPASMPDFIGGDSPTLRLPSLQVLEDGKKNRSIAFAPKGESDVDLLIRLTEMSRVSPASASASTTGRARFPSAPAHAKGHSHSPAPGPDFMMNDSTPRAKSTTRAVFPGYGISQLDRFPPI